MASACSSWCSGSPAAPPAAGGRRARCWCSPSRRSASRGAPRATTAAGTRAGTRGPRFPISTLESWRHLVQNTLRPHRDQAARILREVPAADRDLDRHPEPERAALGLSGPVRQALVYERCYAEELEPKLRGLGLL